MASVTARRPTPLTAPAVLDFAASTSPFSPLDQVGFAVTSDPVAAPPVKPEAPQPTPPIPTLDFNLFRSPSVYSVDSSLDSTDSDYNDEGYGFGFVSEPEEGLDSDSTEDGGAAISSSFASSSLLLSNILQLQRGEIETESSVSSPATPRARRTSSGDNTVAGATPSASGTTTPTHEIPIIRDASSVSHCYPELSTSPRALRSAVSEVPFNLQPVPLRTGRSLSGPAETESSASSSRTATLRSCSDPVPQPQPAPVVARPHHTTVPDTASVHGEQGSDWGEDENGFEWLDNQGGPEATNGMQRKPSLLRLSPRRLTLLRSVVGGSSEESPSGPEPPAPGSSTASSPAPAAPRLKKKRTIVIPRRAAPPPPPTAPFVPPNLASSPPKAVSRNTPSPAEAELLTPEATESRYLPPVIVVAPTPPRKGSASVEPSIARSAGLVSPASQMSSYSMSPKHTDATSEHDPHTIPRGRYPKLSMRKGEATSPPASLSNELNGHSREPSGPVTGRPRRGSGGSTGSDQWEAEEQRRWFNSFRRESSSTASSPTASSVDSSMNIQGKSPASLVAAGIARRKAGDLPKSAWLFMKAAQAGSVAGQIHFGLALRHGLGIARDDRKAFSELVHACDRSIAEGGVDLRAAAGATILSPAQQRNFAPDTALALIEVGNCYLEGLGIKRNPELAIEYLRMAGSLGDLAALEQLGYILSKGVNGVKKDMREAAKWYRAALAAGSNIPGLAWVWKDKYNDA